MAKEKNDSQENYEQYRKGKAPLKNAVLQHPDDNDNSIYGFMKKSINRRLWVIPFKKWEKMKFGK